MRFLNFQLIIIQNGCQLNYKLLYNSLPIISTDAKLRYILSTIQRDSNPSPHKAY